MYFTCDDIGIDYKNQLFKLDKLKKKYPNFKVTVFVIAKDLDEEIINWLKQDWIEVAIHCYDHSPPPECECPDKEERINKAFKILKPLLPEKYGFRPPGFQMTASTFPLLKKLGFWYIAHQTKIQVLQGTFNNELIVNSHIYDDLDLELNGEFKFISEGFI